MMQDTFMSDSEDEGGEVECEMQQQQQYRYMTAEVAGGGGGGTLGRTQADVSATDGHRWPSNNETSASHSHLPNTGFLVSFIVDARGGSLQARRRGGARVLVPPGACLAPTRLTVRPASRRAPPPPPPPLMEGEALACRLLELQPHGAKFHAPVVIEVPIYCVLSPQRELVVLRSDTGETWQDHALTLTDNPALQEAAAREAEREPVNEFGESVARVVTTELPHYLAVVTRVRQDVHVIGADGGAISSRAVPQVQALFPPHALTKRIRVGLQAHRAPAQLCARLLPRDVAVSPVLTVEPRRRKFHRTITLTMPLPAHHDPAHAATPPANQSLRLLCSIMGGQARAVWEDVTGSTPISVAQDTASFTTTVSARFWLMSCRNVSEATKLATALYREMLLVELQTRLVVLATRLDAREGRLLLTYVTDRSGVDALLDTHSYTQVAQSTCVCLREGAPVYVEFSGNLVPVTKSGEQPALTFEAFKDNRVEFAVRLKRDTDPPAGRLYFMNQPKSARAGGATEEAPVCVLDVALPSGANQHHDTLDQSGFDALKEELSGDATRLSPVPPHLTNGHANKTLSNGHVNREDHSAQGAGGAGGGGRATFDSDEERTPAGTLEKSRNKPAPAHVIDEQLLDKMEDAFKDLKQVPKDSQPHDTTEQTALANKSEQAENNQTPQQAERKQTKQGESMQIVAPPVTQQLRTLHDDFIHAEKSVHIPHEPASEKGDAGSAGQARADLQRLIGDVETEAVRAVTQSASETRDTLTQRAKETQDNLAQRASEIQEDITQRASEVRDGLTQRAKETQDDLTQHASEIEDVATKRAVEMREEVTKHASDAHDSLALQASEIRDAVAQTASETQDAVAQRVSETKDEVAHKASEIVDAVTQRGSEIAESVKRSKSETENAVKERVSEIKDDVANAVGNAVTETTAQIERASETATERVRETEDAINHLNNHTTDNVNECVETARRLVEEVEATALQTLSQADETAAQTASLLEAERVAADTALKHKKGSAIPKLKLKKKK